MFELGTVGYVSTLRIKFKFLIGMETQELSYWFLQSFFVVLLERRSLRVIILLEGDVPLSTHGRRPGYQLV